MQAINLRYKWYSGRIKSFDMIRTNILHRRPYDRLRNARNQKYIDVHKLCTYFRITKFIPKYVI